MSLAALALTLALAATPVMAAANLSSLQWQNRVLVVFAEPGTPAREQQLQWLAADGDGLAERDMLVLAVGGDTVETVAGSSGSFDAASLRAALAPEPGPFSVVLVGKDGGVKLRQSTPLPVADLFATVDAMPMRRTEQQSQ